MTRWFVLLVLLLAVPSRAQPSPPAFPGAEGFGASATGGRGKFLYIVTTLEDDGPGGE